MRDLKSRNPCDSLLVSCDGAPGLMRASKEACPRSLRQRCLAHNMRNMEANAPLEEWPEPTSAAWSVHTVVSPKLVELLSDERVRAHERELPAATACVLDDFAACIDHRKLRLAHCKATRTTNFLERRCSEERQCSKVIPHTSASGW